MYVHELVKDAVTGPEAGAFLQHHFVHEHQLDSLKSAATSAPPGQELSTPWAACLGRWTVAITPLEQAVFLVAAFGRGYRYNNEGVPPPDWTLIPREAGDLIADQLLMGKVVPHATRLNNGSCCWWRRAA